MQKGEWILMAHEHSYQKNCFVLEKLRRMCVYDMHGSACTSSVVLALNIRQLWKPTLMYYNIKYNNKVIRSMIPPLLYELYRVQS